MSITQCRSAMPHKNWILKQRYVSWTPLTELTSEDICDVFSEILELVSFIIKISPTL